MHLGGKKSMMCSYLSTSRHHHSSDHVHHHHWCFSLHATGLLCQSRRHLPVGELPVCLPLRHWVRGCQLFHHSGGDEEAETSQGCWLPESLLESEVKNNPIRVNNSPLWPLLLQIPDSYNATEAMAFDGCFHDTDIDLTSFPEVASTPNTERNTQARNSMVSVPTEGTRLRRKHPIKQHVSFIMSNSYMIDSYSRVIFPLAYLLFNIIYWSLYAWSMNCVAVLQPNLLLTCWWVQVPYMRNPAT